MQKPPQKYKVAYIEDHVIVKEGLEFLLSQYPEIEIIKNVFICDKLSEFVANYSPDFFILDLHLHTQKIGFELLGYEICLKIKTEYPNIKVIIHSMYDDIETVNKCFDNLADGFVSKISGHTELLAAINEVANHKKYICKEIAKKCKNYDTFILNSFEKLKSFNEPFTIAEKNILKKIAKGYSTKQIASQLKISEKTVEAHRKNMFDKSKVKNVAELIAFTYSRRILID